MEKIIELLEYNNVKMHPCSNSDVDAIEEKCRGKLPGEYVKFLKVTGRGADHYMEGSSWIFDELDSLQTEAALLLKENGFRPLPPSSFVFWMHQGYQFAFFVIGEGDDPPVYYYNETIKRSDFARTYNKLTDFFYDEILNSNLEIPKK